MQRDFLSVFSFSDSNFLLTNVHPLNNATSRTHFTLFIQYLIIRDMTAADNVGQKQIYNVHAEIWISWTCVSMMINNDKKNRTKHQLDVDTVFIKLIINEYKLGHGLDDHHISSCDLLRLFFCLLGKVGEGPCQMNLPSPVFFFSFLSFFRCI